MVERFEGRGRHLEINIPKIAIFATKYFHDYPNARWNGRQIRNACQTVLAIAEYEAQGSKHDASMKPDAVITLNETHFETVAVAYSQFIEYVHKIWSTYADEKASEDKIRAPVTKGPPNPLDRQMRVVRGDQKSKNKNSTIAKGSPADKHIQHYPISQLRILV